MEKLPFLSQISAYNILCKISGREMDNMLKKRRIFAKNCRCRDFWTWANGYCCLWCRNLRAQFVIAYKRQLLNHLLSFKRRKFITIPVFKYFTSIIESFFLIKNIKNIRRYAGICYDFVEFEPLCWIEFFEERFYEHLKISLGVYKYVRYCV